MPIPPPRPAGRPVCYRCLKPDAMCVCAEIRPIETRFRLVILQHPQEFRRTISTARIVSLSVEGCRLFAGIDFSEHQELARMLDPAAGPAYVVYPERGAPEAGELAESEDRWPGASPLFVLVDGTWGQARKIKNQNPVLARLPKVTLRADQPSQYLIRRQPRAGCLSTVEAAALLLSRLEGKPAIGEAMIEVFQQLVARAATFKVPHRPASVPGARPPGMDGHTT